MSFLPKDYVVPVSNNYLKLVEGENSFRVLSSAIVGYEYFSKDNKPVRSVEPFEERPVDIKVNGRVNPFWAFVVWNYNEAKIQIMEITQKTIMFPVKSLVDNPKWGDPKAYDISITRKGTGIMDTEYSVMPNPHSEVEPHILEQYRKTPVDLKALYIGADPFEPKNASLGGRIDQMPSMPDFGGLDAPSEPQQLTTREMTVDDVHRQKESQLVAQSRGCRPD